MRKENSDRNRKRYYHKTELKKDEMNIKLK